MPRSSRLFLFPDINVWIALTYRGHKHFDAAATWFNSIPDDSALCFSRLTQLGFLRLLTTSAVMGDRVMSQTAAWRVYDDWTENGGAVFVDEPPSVERIFRSISRSWHPTPKDWADSYVCAFAQASGLRLVTFDQALQRRTTGSVLLGP